MGWVMSAVVWMGMVKAIPFSVQPTQGCPMPMGQQSTTSLNCRVEQGAWVTGPLHPSL
jgi:hypothetical protein